MVLFQETVLPQTGTQGKTTFTRVRVKNLGFPQSVTVTFTFLKYFVKVTISI